MSAPRVVMYLHVHAAGEAFEYPTSRAGAGPQALAARYLECALVQAVSLRAGAPDADARLVLSTADPAALGRRGTALLRAIEAQGVQVVEAPYAHAPREATVAFAAVRYVLDAIGAAAADDAAAVAMVDVDCVWRRPADVLAATPREGVGAVVIPYAPDHDLRGVSRRSVGALGARLGACEAAPPWIGGELLLGSAAALRELVAACDRLDGELAALGHELGTEEELLTLAGGLGRLAVTDLSHVAGRIWTGPRHTAANPADPAALALWHLPSEKGLSFRRAAEAVRRGRAGAVRRDVLDDRRAARRFNVGDASLVRRLRDDAWLASGRVRDVAARVLPRTG